MKKKSQRRRLTYRLAVGLTVATLGLLAALGGGSAASAGVASHEGGQPSWRLDPTFGHDGSTLTAFPFGSAPSTQGSVTLVQPDGRILVAGRTADLHSLDDVADVARYRSNGTLDPSFGDGGRVMLGPHSLYDVSAITVQDVGGQQKILLAVRTTFQHPLRFRCSVVRLNADGTLDSDHDADPGLQFADEGIKVIRFAGNSGFCSDLTTTPDGQIVGIVEAGHHRGDVGVFRLGADGALDPTFGGDGKMTVVSRGFQVPVAVVMQPRPHDPDRIVVGGLVSRPAGYDWALWRITATGRLDRSFGRQGLVVTPMRDPKVAQSFDTVDSLVVMPNRDIVAAGRYRAWPEDARYPQDTAAVARYLPDGTRDASFGNDGRFHLPYDAAAETEALDVTLDPAGRILYAGPWAAPTYGKWLVGGLLADGSPDPRFGAAKSLTFVVRGGYDLAAGLALDNQGRLIVAGVGGDPSGRVRDLMGVARLTADG